MIREQMTLGQLYVNLIGVGSVLADTLDMVRETVAHIEATFPEALPKALGPEDAEVSVDQS
jgi:hypothetical protein